MIDQYKNPDAPSLFELLNRITAASPKWSRGDNLLLLEVSHELFCRVGDEVIRLRNIGVSQLDRQQQQHWGAAMILSGAQAFQRMPDGPFTYESIWEMLGASPMGSLDVCEYNAMEQGACFVWGISIPRNRHNRRQFRGTMLFHSGCGWLVLEAVADQVSSRWSWEGVAQCSVEDVEDWLEEILTSPYLPGSARKALESDEGRFGTAQRLQQIAEARERILRQGWVCVDVTQTAQAIHQAGIELRELFEAPTDEAASRLLPLLFNLSSNHTESRLGTIAWRWDISRAVQRHRLVIEIPAQLRIPDIPFDTERVQLHLIGESDGCVFERTNGHFNHLRGPRTLLLPSRPAFPLDVIASFKTGEHDREVAIGQMPFPADPVATFITESGRWVDSVPAGTRVGLVCASGYRLRFVPGFSSTPLGPFEGWVGRMPAEPIELELEVNDTLEHWTLAPSNRRLEIALNGAKVSGLRFGLSPAFRRWPAIWLESHVRSGRYHLAGPGGDEEGDFRSRAGRLNIGPAQPQPGLYHLTLESRGRCGTASFVLLPADAGFTILSNEHGTEINASGTLLRRMDGPGIGEGSLRLPLGERGWINLGISFADPKLATVQNGRWAVLVSPSRVQVVRKQGGLELEGFGDIGALQGEGGLELGGSPGSSAVIAVRSRRFSVRLDSEGRRFFPFANLPRERLLHSDRALVLDVHIGSEHHRRIGPFVNQRAVRPTVQVAFADDGRCRVSLQLRTPYAVPLHLEAVPASEPWRSRWRVPCVQRAETWYDAFLPDEPGLYIVALMHEETRVSGMAAVVRPTSATALPTDEYVEPRDGLSRRARAEQHSEITLDGVEASTAAEADPGDVLGVPPRTGRPRYREVRIVNNASRRSGIDKKLLMEEVRAQMKEGLQADGIEFLYRVAEPLARYGPRWFLISEAFIEQATAYRLSALLASQDEVRAGLLLEVFDEQGIPWLATTYDDFDFLKGKLLTQSGRDVLRGLRELGEHQAGLLIPAWMSWQDHTDLETVWPRLAQVLAPWDELFSGQPDRLEQRELDLFTTFDQRVSPEKLTRRPRVRGLLEAWTRQVPSDELRTLLDGINSAHRERLAHLRERRLIPELQRSIPSRVLDLESLVILYTHQIHRWRKGEPFREDLWNPTRTLWQELPTLTDYWLNRWAASRAKE